MKLRERHYPSPWPDEPKYPENVDEDGYFRFEGKKVPHMTLAERLAYTQWQAEVVRHLTYQIKTGYEVDPVSLRKLRAAATNVRNRLDEVADWIQGKASPGTPRSPKKRG